VNFVHTAFHMIYEGMGKGNPLTLVFSFYRSHIKFILQGKQSNN